MDVYFLYNHLQKNERWLKSRRRTTFLEKYGATQRVIGIFAYREGKPLISPSYISDCFATMAFAQLSKATGKAAYSEIAVNTFNNILKRADNPKGIYEKSVPGTRPIRGFSLPMILCNLALETEHLLDKKTVENIIRKCIRDVMEVFYDSSSGLIRENVTADGGFSDSFEGRLINPGHGIEAMWFIMDLAERNNDSTLAEKAVERTLNI